MAIDVIFGITMLVAAIKGWKRGAIVAIFTLLSIIVGLAAAMKLATWVAHLLQTSTEIPSKWLPLLAFLLVFLGVVLLSRMVAALLENAVEMFWLGPFNHIAGAFIYVVLYALSFSVILFFVVQLRLISASTLNSSKVYDIIQPWGPWVLDGLGKWIPYFKDLFKDLQHYFENLSGKLSH